MTSNDLKTTSNDKKTRSKNVLKAGSVQEENIVFNEHYLDKIPKTNDFQMELAMQISSTNQKVRINTIQDLKDFNQQSLSTRAKKQEQLVSMMPAIKEAFNLMTSDIVELSTENDTLKNEIGNYDEKWLEESKAKLLKDIDDEKRANLIMSRMKKQMNKQN